MKEIELVVKIPEEEYEIIKNHTGPMTWAEHLIKNGAPLPKGHGDLKDADVMINKLCTHEASELFGSVTCAEISDFINSEKPIIESDKESEGCLNKTEIHCQYSDKEIAKSFIEDVETVKEFLPCGEQMEFPSTFDEFAKDYGFVDKKEIYTNGSELIPIFRVKQWLEHIKTEQKSDVFDKIKAEMQSYSDSFVLAKRNDLANAVSYCIKIIDKYGER